MASNTARFNLLKKDPITDGNDNFDIATMINENFDKLDAAAKKTELDTLEQKSTNYVTTTNTGNSYSATYSPAFTSLYAGLRITVKINANSTGNCTINVNGLGTKNILKPNGSNVNNLKSNGVYTFVYNGTAFTLQGEGGEGTAIASEVLSGETFTNDTGDVITGTMPNRGAVSITPSTISQPILAGYHNGSGNVASLGGNAVASNVLTGVTFSSDSAGRAQSGAMTNRGAVSIIPNTISQNIPQGYHSGAGSVASLGGNAVASNVLAGTTFSSDSVGRAQSGSMPNRAGDTSALASSISGTTLKLRASDGYRDGVDDNVTITDADFIASNIKSGVNLFGLAGSLASIKSIQHGSVVPFNNTTTKIYSHTISSVDASKSIVLINYFPQSSNNDTDDIAISAQVTGATTLSLRREGNGQACTSTVYYTVIEFENVASKQTGSEAINGNTTDTITISSVNLAKSLLIVTFRSTNSNIASLREFIPIYYFASSNSISIRNNSNYADIAIFEWQVIQFN